MIDPAATERLLMHHPASQSQQTYNTKPNGSKHSKSLSSSEEISLRGFEESGDLTPLVNLLLSKGRKVEVVRRDEQGRIIMFRTQCFNPNHGDDGYDEHPSMVVKLENGRLLVHCFVCGKEKQDVVWKFFAEAIGCVTPQHQSGNGSGVGDVDDETNETGNAKPTAIYEICERNGTLIALHLRYDKSDGRKSFVWQLPDGTMGLNGIKACDLPLYGIHKLQPNTNVVIVEGEKAAEALWSVGVQAVATYGANIIPIQHRLRELIEIVGSGKIYLWSDNDVEGKRHMEVIAEKLLDEVGFERVLVVQWKDAPEKGDAADAVAAGVDVRALLQNSKPSIPQPTTATNLSQQIGKTANDWLVQDLLAIGDVAILSARPKTAKSLVALNLAISVANGEVFLGFLTKQGRVLFLAFERRDLTIQRAEGLGAGNNPNLLFWDTVNFGAQPRINQLKLLERTIRAHRISLVVVDTLAHFIKPFLEQTKGNLNAYDLVYGVFEEIKAVAERTGCVFLFIHHDKKGEANDEQAVLGSTAITGAADVIIQLQSEGSDTIKMKIVGNRVEDRMLWFRVNGLAIEPTEEPAITEEERARRIILRELYRAGDEGVKRETLIGIIKDELRKETPTAAERVTERALRGLSESGFVETPKRGVYVLTEDGRLEAVRFVGGETLKHQNQHHIQDGACGASACGVEQSTESTKSTNGAYDACGAYGASDAKHQNHQPLHSGALVLPQAETSSSEPPFPTRKCETCGSTVHGEPDERTIIFACSCGAVWNENISPTTLQPEPPCEPPTEPTVLPNLLTQRITRVQFLPLCVHCGSDDVALVDDRLVCIACGNYFTPNKPTEPEPPSAPTEPSEPSQTNEPPSAPTEPNKPSSALSPIQLSESSHNNVNDANDAFSEPMSAPLTLSEPTSPNKLPTRRCLTCGSIVHGELYDERTIMFACGCRTAWTENITPTEPPSAPSAPSKQSNAPPNSTEPSHPTEPLSALTNLSETTKPSNAPTPSELSEPSPNEQLSALTNPTNTIT